MKVLFVCGSYPPDPCAIADVSFIIVNLLRAKNIDVEIVANIDWRLKNIKGIKKIIFNSKADLIHIQYPSMGFGTSLIPQFIALFYRANTIVTIHEVSQSHIVRKLSLIPFSFCSKIVFTNKFEANYYKQKYFFSNRFHRLF